MTDAEMPDKLLEWVKAHMLKYCGAMSQAAAGKHFGLSQPHISRLFRGERAGDAHLSTVETMAKALGCETWRLVWAIEEGQDIQPRPGSKKP